MNRDHLEDFLRIHDLKPEISVGSLVSEYTSLAVSFAGDPKNFAPDDFDYDLAYKIVIDKYKGDVL